MSATTLHYTEHQRLVALDHANEIRIGRARLKHQIGAGEVTAARVILQPPDAALGWTVYDVLRSQRRWGRVRAVNLLRRAYIAESKTVRELTGRQRRLLADQLGDREGQ